jgi:hypothetical protein
MCFPSAIRKCLRNLCELDAATSDEMRTECHLIVKTLREWICMVVTLRQRYLREVEGSLRDVGRPLTQLELVRAIRKEQGKSISQSYISQIVVT